MNRPLPVLDVLFAALVTLLATGPLLCLAGDPSPADMSPRDAVRPRLQLPPMPVPAVTLHVSPRGSDTAPGTKAKPFATLERCREEIRVLKGKGPLPKGGVLVVIHGGEYAATRTFSLSGEDSGTEAAPIRYVAAPGKKPVFKGGKKSRKVAAPD